MRLIPDGATHVVIESVKMITASKVGGKRCMVCGKTYKQNKRKKKQNV